MANEKKDTTRDWGAFAAFLGNKDAHGDSNQSFSLFTIFFVILASLGIGYYTYYQAQGATGTRLAVGTAATSTLATSTIGLTTTPTSLQSGLVGHWTFDGPQMDWASTTGEVRNSISGGPRGDILNFTSSGATIGKVGQAFNFDGTDDYVQTVGSSTGYQFPNSTFSVTGWFKSIASPNGFIVAQGYCFGGWGATLLSGSFSFAIRTNGSCGQNAASRTSASTNLNDGRWHHFAAVATTNTTSSTSNDVTVYIDGIVNQGSISRIGTPYGTTTSELTIGVSNGLAGYFSGGIDDVRIYNRALTAEEIEQLYILGSGSKVKICREASVQDADGNTYNTLAIGSQCWLDRNMNVGTRISAAGDQTNNATIEKYCFDDLDTNCTTNHPNKPDGGLYQWDEAMQYTTTEGARGICPVGFHIPTEAEWHTLETYLSDSGQDCSGTATGNRCDPAGTKLKAGGSTSFNANLAGYVLTAVFNSRDTNGYWWSSSEVGTGAWRRIANVNQLGLGRATVNQAHGLSIRCIQD